MVMLKDFMGVLAYWRFIDNKATYSILLEQKSQMVLHSRKML